MRDRLGGRANWGGIGAAALLTTWAAACSDSLHLDPTPTPGTTAASTTATGSGGAGGDATTTTSTSGGGGEGGAPPVIDCVSNSDCPEPQAVCDTTKNKCVECLEIEDCAFRPGTVCSVGTCVCPGEGESFCPAEPGLAARCVDRQSSPVDCGECGHACFGACNAGKCADPWEPTTLIGAPSARTRHVAVAAGGKMIIWGGEPAGGGYTNTGGIYDLATRKWTPMSTANAPTPRSQAKAVWSGTEMLVWGGTNGAPLGTGGRFNPTTNTWKPITTSGAPSPRYAHTAVAAGTDMIVWGGFDDSNNLNTGGIYKPGTDTWTATDTGTAPTQRRDHTAVMGGATMIVFGGYGYEPSCACDTYRATGAELNPVANTWIALQELDQPGVRYRHTAAWSGADMIVWGGHDGSSYLADGKEYAPLSTSWTPINNDPSPSGRQLHTSVWIGGSVNRMITWGGENGSGVLDSGGIYDPTPNTWAPMPTAPVGRSWHTAVVISNKMVIWGGSTASGNTNSGAVFDPAFMP